MGYNDILGYVILVRKINEISIFLQPEDFSSSFNELESIIKDKLNDKVIWKKCLIIVMDTCKGFFAKVCDTCKYIVNF